MLVKEANGRTDNGQPDTDSRAALALVLHDHVREFKLALEVIAHPTPAFGSGIQARLAHTHRVGSRPTVAPAGGQAKVLKLRAKAAAFVSRAELGRCRRRRAPAAIVVELRGSQIEVAICQQRPID